MPAAFLKYPGSCFRCGAAARLGQRLVMLEQRQICWVLLKVCL